jgi:hypothetical protein
MFMQIKDSKGFYLIDFDANKLISSEKNIGLWSKEDYLRYHNEYVSKIQPLLGGKPWAKLVDITEYKTSDIADVMGTHVDWMLKNNARYAAVIVSSSIAKMQVNMVVSGKFEQKAFTSRAEAIEWLTSKGFK